LIYVGAMFDKRLDRGWISESHRVMKGGNAILVGGMHVGTGLQRLQKPHPLVRWIGIALATNIE
jgi:hypothetical protein